MKILGNDNDIPQEGSANESSVHAHLKDAKWLECEKCGGSTFIEALQIKKISKFLTGSERDSIAPYPVIACASCGHVNSELEPKL